MTAEAEDSTPFEASEYVERPAQTEARQLRSPLSTILAILILPLSLGLALLMGLLAVVLALRRLFGRFRR